MSCWPQQGEGESEDSLLHATQRAQASTSLWNLRFSCTISSEAHLQVLVKWIDEAVQMLANKHPLYQNEFPYPYDIARVLHVTEIYLQLNRVERSYQKCDLCQQTIRFPLLLPCPSLHLLCTECVFPQIFSQNLCRRPPLRYCPMCWPHYRINPDFFDRLQSPVEHNTTFDWPYKTHGARANAELDRRSLAFRRQRLARRLQAEAAAAGDWRQLQLLHQLRGLEPPRPALAVSPFPVEAAGGGARGGLGGDGDAGLVTETRPAAAAAAVNSFASSSNYDRVAEGVVAVSAAVSSFACASQQTATAPSSSSSTHSDNTSSRRGCSGGDVFDGRSGLATTSSSSGAGGTWGMFGRAGATQRGMEREVIYSRSSEIRWMFDNTHSARRDAYEAEKARVSPLAVEIVRRWFPEPWSGTALTAPIDQPCRLGQTRQQETPPRGLPLARRQQSHEPRTGPLASPVPFGNEEATPRNSRSPLSNIPQSKTPFFSTAAAAQPLASRPPSPPGLCFQRRGTARQQEKAAMPQCSSFGAAVAGAFSTGIKMSPSEFTCGNALDGKLFASASNWSAMRARDRGVGGGGAVGDRYTETCSYPRYIDVKDPFLFQFETEETARPPHGPTLTTSLDSSPSSLRRASPLSPSAAASSGASTSDGEILRLLLSQRSLAPLYPPVSGVSDFSPSRGGLVSTAVAGAVSFPAEPSATLSAGRRGNAPATAAQRTAAEGPVERSQRAAAAARTKKENALLSLLLCGGVAASEVAAWAQEADIDEDDAIFFCSSKNVLVVRRILSIIHSGKYAQNNVPDHLLERPRRSNAAAADGSGFEETAAAPSAVAGRAAAARAAATGTGVGKRGAVKRVGFAVEEGGGGVAVSTITGGKSFRGETVRDEARRQGVQEARREGEGKRKWLPGRLCDPPLRQERAETKERKEDEKKAATDEDAEASRKDGRHGEVGDGRRAGREEDADEEEKGREERRWKKRVGFQLLDGDEAPEARTQREEEGRETGTPTKIKRLRWSEQAEERQQCTDGESEEARRNVMSAVAEEERETQRQQLRSKGVETRAAGQRDATTGCYLPAKAPRSILKKEQPSKNKTQLLPRCAKIIVASSLWESLFLLGCFLEKHNVRCGHFYEKMHEKEGRDATIKRFQRDCSTTVLLLSTNLGAHGLDLSCASHILLLDPPTDPNVEHQVISRAHRMGALRDVHVEVFILKDTVEEAILRFRGSWATPSENGRPTPAYDGSRKPGGSTYRQRESLVKFSGKPAVEDCPEETGGNAAFACDGPRKVTATSRSRRQKTTGCTGATHTHIRKLRLRVPSNDEGATLQEDATAGVHTNASGEDVDAAGSHLRQGVGKGSGNDTNIQSKHLHPTSIMQKCQPDWLDMHEESIGLGEGLQRQTEYLLRTLRTIRRLEV